MRIDRVIKLVFLEKCVLAVSERLHVLGLCVFRCSTYLTNSLMFWCPSSWTFADALSS